MAENLIQPENEPIHLESSSEDDEPISLVEPEVSSTEFKPGGVKTFGVGAMGEGQKVKEYKRPLNLNGSGATRCRLFHSKIAIAPLEFMEEQINEWLDQEQIEIKHVGHVIGTMEGKRPEPNFIVMVWY